MGRPAEALSLSSAADNLQSRERTCINVCAPHVCNAHTAEEENESPRAGVRGGCEHP